MRFQHPEYLLFLVILPIVAYWFYQRRAWMLSVIQKLGGEARFGQVLKGFSEKKQRRRFLILSSALLLLVFGLSNIQLPENKQLEKSNGVPVLLALDVSHSMLASDIAPNRLERSIAFLSKLIDELHGHQVGLVAFAGVADVIVPPSNDYAFLKKKLGGLSPESVTVQGTALGSSLRLCSRTLKGKAGAVIVLTDAEDHESDAIAAAQILKEKGGYLFTFGVGSTKGGPVPTGAGYKKDAQGKTIHTKLNKQLLSAVGEASKGTTAVLAEADELSDMIVSKISQIDRGEIQLVDGFSYQSYFQWFLGGAFLLLLFDFWRYNKLFPFAR